MTDQAPTEAQKPFEIKSLGRHSLVYGVGLVLTKVVSFLMLPIYTRLLTVSDYGVLQLIFMTFEVVTIIAGSRIGVGIFHFYQKETTDEGRNEVLSTAFIVLSVTYSAAALLTIVTAPSIAQFVFGSVGDFALFIQVAAVTMVFEGLFTVPLALIQLEERSRVYVAVNLARLGLQVILNLIFLIPFDMGVLGVLLGGMVTHLVVGGALSGYLLWRVGFKIRSRFTRDFLRFGIPLVLMQIATFAATFGDRYFLNQAGDTAIVGLYGLAYQFGFLVVNLGFGPFNRIWDPQRFAVARRPDRDEIFARVFIYMNVLLFSAALGIALYAGDVIRIMADSDFHSAAVYVPLLAAAYVFQSWGSFLNLGIYLKEKTGYFALANWVAAIVAVLGYIVLIPEYLAWGATIATVASTAVRCWLAHVFSQRLWRVEYEWWPVIRLGALATGVGVVAWYLPAMSIVGSFMAHTVLYGSFLAVLWFFPILGADERDAIQRLVKRQLELRLGRS